MIAWWLLPVCGFLAFTMGLCMGAWVGRAAGWDEAWQALKFRKY